tara:strand:- start:135 stop:1790 length:1656 start_codon:yes stop_codon:yes gene_type:complete
MTIFSFLELLSIGTIVPFLGALISINDSTKQLAYPFNLIELYLGTGKFLIYITLFFIGINLTSSFVRVFTAKRQWKLIYQITADLSQMMFSKIIDQDYKYFLRSNSNNIASSANSSLQLLTGSTLIPIFNILGGSLLCILLIIGLFCISSISAIVAFSFLSITYYFFLLSSKKQLSINSNIVVKTDLNRQKLISESIGSIRDIIIDEAQDTFNHEYSINDSAYWNATAKSQFLSAYPRFVLEGVSLSIFAIIAVMINATSPDSSETTLPIVGSFALAANKLLPSAQLLFTSVSQMRFSSQAVYGVLAFINLPLKTKLNSQKIEMRKGLRFENVNFSYDSRKAHRVLKNVSLSLDLGEIIGIVGPSGSGKSTIADLMLGLIFPDTGSITVNNIPLDQKIVSSWRKYVAHVPQSIYLRNATIAENIAFCKSKEEIDYKRLKKVIEMSSMENYINNLSNGFFENVGENGIKLSGGQKQRIGIARALYKNARFIILDEATSALDIKTEAEIMKSIYSIIKNNKIGIVIITHRISTLSGCSRIYNFTDKTLESVSI